MLFIHIVSNPGAETAQSDLVLMNIASGFACRLNFETDGALNWPFIREWTEFASTIVHRARPLESDLAQAGEPMTSAMNSLGADVQNEPSAYDIGEGQYYQEVCLSKVLPTISLHILQITGGGKTL